MTKRLSVCDFETASSVDLKVVGAWAYAEHPTTEALCLSFEHLNVADGCIEILTWAPGGNRAANGMYLRRMCLDPEVVFASHGDFERAIWHHIMVPIYGFPPLPNDRWHDTMSVAAQKQLPLELDKLTKVLRLPDTKDREGSAFTRALSKPNRKTGMLDRSPASLQRAYLYCESDVRSERGVQDRIGFLQPSERKVWLLDQTINQRGIRVDMDYVLACQKIVKEATEPLAKEFIEITGGLKFTQRDKIMGWLAAEGYPLPDLRKERLADLLGEDIDAVEEDDDDAPEGTAEGDSPGEHSGNILPAHIHRALSIRQLVGSAAIKKLPRMAACVNSDGRARGLLQYHRAGPGRWAGRILQPQNFPRPTLKEWGVDKNGKPEEHPIAIETLVQALLTGDWEAVEMTCGPAVPAVVNGLRHALVADRKRVFISGDYMQIEARIVLALAGQTDKVKLFETGTPYVDMASTIYGRPISKKNDVAEYTIGKNTVLGCGFQMGAAKFFDRYCPNQSMEFAENVIRTYRKDWAPMVPDVWYALEAAAADTVWSGKPHEAYGVEYRLEDGWLTARLPSGRKIFYWNPQKSENTMPWTRDGEPVIKAGWTYQAIKMGVWRTIYAFGGLQTENVVQGLARDVLVTAMFKLEANGFPLVLTVHDEGLGEPLLADADELAYKQIMEDTDPWVKSMGIPIGVETWIGDRYRK